jgi:SAM-dependent methyltransferase
MPERTLIRDEQLARVDWDFVDDQSESLFSAFHWHPCRFVSQIPANLLSIFCPEGGTVLDPFCGSGTTLVEAQRLGFPSTGVDVNPVSCLISRAKTFAHPASDIEEVVKGGFQRICGEITRKLNDNSAKVPASVQFDKWYSPGVGRQLRAVWDTIQATEGLEHDLLASAFSSILMSVCRETRHWGYVCDNTEPKDHREKDCVAELKHSIDLLIAAYHRRDAYVRAHSKGEFQISAASVICSDAKNLSTILDADSIDVVLTSPPYFGVADYVKSQRLSMEWSEYDIEPLRLLEIGARSKRHRQKALLDYNNEMGRVVTEIRTVLKPGGVAIMVMGESKARKSVVEDFKKAVKDTGLELVNELRRTISFRRRQHPSISEECIFVFRRS